jgi:Xaa-Pro aminopeptidase
MFKIHRNGAEIEGILLNTEDESEALKMLSGIFHLENLMVILTKDKKPIYFIPEMEYSSFDETNIFTGLTTYELEKVD